MFSDPQFWVALAFVVFVIAIFNPVRKLLSSSLDTRIKEIKDSIDQAEDLKNETQANLSDRPYILVNKRILNRMSKEKS